MGNSLKRVVITGPESTGKTVLANQLALDYKALVIPEYAREYIEKLDKKYTYQDIENIAYRQLELEAEYETKTNTILFYDTYLIITKVWFDVVYKQHPDWLNEFLVNSRIDLYLLCNTDLPWIPDGIRENGGEMRESLFLKYKHELELYHLPYRIVKGKGEERLLSAKEQINNYFGI